MARLAHNPGRKSNYVHALNSSGAYWQEVRRAIRIRDNHQCVLCKKQTDLEVHHLTYYSGDGSIVGKEMQHLDKLVLLCSRCHQDVHFDNKHLLNPKNYAHTNHKAKFLEG